MCLQCVWSHLQTDIQMQTATFSRTPGLHMYLMVMTIATDLLKFAILDATRTHLETAPSLTDSLPLIICSQQCTAQQMSIIFQVDRCCRAADSLIEFVLLQLASLLIDVKLPSKDIWGQEYVPSSFDNARC